VAFGSQTAFDLSNATTTLINNTGFWQIRGAIVTSSETTNNPNVAINITDGLTTKQIYELRDFNSGADSMVVDYQEVVFLRTGESLSAAVSAYAAFMGSYRQIADVNGNLVNPVGFTPQ
jgi:hypothetical protein